MFEHHDPYPADQSSADDGSLSPDSGDALDPRIDDGTDGTSDAFAGLDLWPHDIGSFGDSGDGDPAAPEVTVPGADGTEFTGTATYDADGDGVPDTVVIRNSDGSVISATDADGDGVADRLVVVGADGAVTVSELDDDGRWTVTATGEQQPDGTGSVQPAESSDGHPTADPGAADPKTADSGTADSDPADAGAADPDTAESTGPVPAGHIAAAGDHGDIDAGAPQFDMNGDGKPETAVIERDGVMYQYSDIDGDGRADQLLQVTMADHSATIMVDHGDGWTVAVRGHIADDGDFVPDESAGKTQPAAHPQPAAHHDTSGDTSGHTTGNDGPAGQHQQTAADIELTTPEGRHIDVGAPDQDLDGDGVAESVAVRTEDGHLLIVTDSDADGTADQLIDVDPDTGEATWLTVDDDGGWTVTHHGHVTEDGSLAVDGDGDAHDGSQHAAEEQVSVSVDGRSFPAGPATIDSDHDGVADTVAVPGVGGSTQYYQDTDGDGIADRAWTVNADGSRGAEYTIDDRGEWVQARAEQQAQQEPAPVHPPEPVHTPWGRDR